MQLSIDMEGLQEAMTKFSALAAVLDRGQGEVLESLQREFRAELIRTHKASPRGGQMYMRRGVMHVASAPGEPPAPDTGKLMDSFYPKAAGEGLRRVAEGAWEAKVWNTAEYAARLEFGDERVAPRPLWRPVADLFITIAARMVERHWDEILRELR